MRTLLELYPGDHIALLAANVLVQTTVVMLLAWAVAGWVARRGAAARHDVWLCALLGVLSSPLIAYTLDRTGVSILSLPVLPAEQVEPSPLAEEPAADQEPPIDAIWEPPIAEIEWADRTPVLEATEQTEATPAASQPAAPAPLSRADKLRALVGAVVAMWAVGVLVLLTRTIHGWRLLARLRRETRPPGMGNLDELAEQVRHALGIKRLPRIVVAPNVPSPITVGIIRPLLILPKQLTRTLRRDQLRDVLLHECAHVARRDHLVGMLQLFAEMLFWPHPLVHVMNRQLARCREEVCDNYVLRHGDGPRYAQTLLELSRKLVPTTARFAALGLCHPRWRLEDRIGGLLDKRRRTMIRMNACLRSLTVCLLLTAATVVAGTRIVAAQPKEPPALGKPVEIEIIAAEKTDTAEPDTEGKKDSAKRTAAPSKTTVRGKVVDDATGKPVVDFFTEGGKFDLADPAKVVWGYSETHSSRKSGKFSVTVRWPAGWTERIIAAGYLPHPVLTQPPLPGQDVIEVVIRLKRGNAIRGRVLDHTGQSVVKAGVYLAGRGVIGLAEGPWNELQQTSIHTDAEGRFEISGRGKDSKAIFVTAASLFVWRADLPEPGKEAIIRLPEPAKLHVHYDVEGGPPAARVRIELRTWDMPKWKALVDVVRWVDVKAGEDGVVVDNLPPGVYDISRIKHTSAGNSGKDMMLDRQLKLTLASGKTTAYNFVRKTGTPIGGEVVGLPKEGINGVFLYVRDQRASGDPRNRDDWKLRTFDGLALEGNGPFKTERIPPGKYKVVVEAYRQETRGEMTSTGWRLPKWIGTADVDVPESGEPPNVRLIMRSYDAH